MHICQDCGGQNGLHFPKCQHYRAPRYNSASQRPAALPTGAPLPYQHTSPTGRMNMEYPQIQNLPSTLAQNAGGYGDSYAEDPIFDNGNQQAQDPNEPHRSMPTMRKHSAACLTPGGGTNDDECICGAHEHNKMVEAMREQPLNDEQKLVNLLGPDLKATFTHHDKGGRYRLLYTPMPAGAVMRLIGDTVVYESLENKGVFVRDLKDFVAVMQPITFTDS